MMPPFTDSRPATAPATTPTSSRPEILRAATIATTTGIPAIRASKAGVRPSNPGILEIANTTAMAMKAGMAGTMMPRILIRRHGDSVVPAPASADPREGKYLSFQCRASPEA